MLCSSSHSALNSHYIIICIIINREELCSWRVGGGYGVEIACVLPFIQSCHSTVIVSLHGPLPLVVMVSDCIIFHYCHGPFNPYTSFILE